MKCTNSSLTGNIFHIIHGSFVDGYGIRTTVFLKGCPLRCLWCCNPEGQSFQSEIKLSVEKCNGCGLCIEQCNRNAINLQNKDTDIKISIDRNECNGCGNCAETCYTGALELFGKIMTVNAVFDEIKKDEQFYRNSGGGVTIGGGEPTAQPQFTLALIRKCKENNIHTAVDTCGYANQDEELRVLEEADLILFDIKGMDSISHKRNTGISNEVIQRNIKNLNDIGKPMIVRIPVIPGFTDSGDNLLSTADMLCDLRNVERVDLMAFHHYGEIKYSQLEMPCHMNLIQSPAKEKMEEIKEKFTKRGLSVQLGG